MEKRYADAAIFYAAAAMVFGVFYREFTKFNGFTGKTNLSVMHTHYFLLLLEKNFRFSGGEKIGIILTVYHIGLNVTALGFLLRGLTQVWGTELSRGMDASISGLSGVGHIMLGISMILLLLKIRKKTVLEKK